MVANGDHSDEKRVISFSATSSAARRENGERSGGGDGGLINSGPLGIVRMARDRMGSARNIPRSFNKIWTGTGERSGLKCEKWERAVGMLSEIRWF